MNALGCLTCRCRRPTHPCEIICEDNFSRADSEDPGDGSPCGWTISTGDWTIESNALVLRSDSGEGQITSGVTLPSNFEVNVAFDSLTDLEEFRIVLDSRVISIVWSGYSYNITYDDGTTGVCSFAAGSNPSSLLLIVRGGNVYLYFPGVSGYVLAVGAIGTVSSVGVGFRNIAEDGDPKRITSFSVTSYCHSVGTVAPHCLLFESHFGSGKEGQGPGAYWRDVSGSIIEHDTGDPDSRPTHFALGSLTSQELYVPRSDYIRGIQIRIVIDGSLPGEDSTLTLEFGGTTAELKMIPDAHGGDFVCRYSRLNDSYWGRSETEEGLSLDYDGDSGTIALNADSFLCDYYMSVPTTFSISADGPVRLLSVEISTTGWPDECPNFELPCNCYEIGISACSDWEESPLVSLTAC